ncbi:MAG: hypothetical protein EOP05_13780 [Proteobacteria bacterium]|nr:MAG: hypothetical protein EOP05_13780 [Pseudomonadota bacterium]
MSGYDKFFKEAGKTSGLITGKPAPKSGAKPKFKLNGNASKKSSREDSEPSRGRSRDRIMIGSPEDQLRREIAIRSKARKSASMKKRQAFPVFPAIVAVVAIISCGIGYFQPELVDSGLVAISNFSGIEISAFGSANASEAEAAKKGAGKTPAKQTAKQEAKRSPDAEKISVGGAPDAAKLGAGLAGTEVAAKTETPADIRSWSDEELSFFNKLNDRKKELDLRESELAKLEEELQKQKTELDGKIKQLEDMRTDISKTLKTRVAVDQEKVEKLVQTYSTMKAQNAAKIIETLNEDLAVEVMDKMKKKSAAEIMNMMDAKKARRISELLTGYQRSPANAGEKEEAPAENSAE